MKNRVKELRIAAGMTQQQLAERVHVSSRTIISLEKEQYKRISAEINEANRKSIVVLSTHQ